MDRYNHILICLALAERDKNTIQYGAMISRLATSKKVHFIHVVRHHEIPQAMREAYPKLLEPIAESDQDRLAGLVSRYFTSPPDVEVICDVVEGSPATEILDLLRREQIDLVIVGKTSRAPQQRLLAGETRSKSPMLGLGGPRGQATGDHQHARGSRLLGEFRGCDEDCRFVCPSCSSHPRSLPARVLAAARHASCSGWEQSRIPFLSERMCGESDFRSSRVRWITMALTSYRNSLWRSIRQRPYPGQFLNTTWICWLSARVGERRLRLSCWEA